MNYEEDEPRKVPKPISFCQNPLLSPAVPEVSLIFQKTNKSPVKNDSFSGTEFQTYNAWRWKNMNQNNKREKSAYSECSKTMNCCIIKDKYFTSDVEKRKNEILYGDVDKPREPLAPRPSPVIPNCLAASFSDASYSCVNDENLPNENSNITKHDVEDLYKIITEQNKQLVALQKQIDQLLKTQQTKDKQTEQLLKSHDIKEKQIEQLLNSQDMKENKIEQLLSSQEKKERQIEQLLRSQEKKERQIEQLINAQENQKLEVLKHIKERKEFVSVGVMTSTNLTEKGTNTSQDSSCVNCRKENGERNFKDLTVSETLKDRSFTLRSIDLPTIQEHIPTPQSSIHVDIQDFKDSSDEESDDSCSSRSKAFVTPIHADENPLGCTFYNNLLTQVKDILENSNENEKKREENEIRTKNGQPFREFNHCQVQDKHDVYQRNYNYDVATQKTSVEQFHAWGVNVMEKENCFPVHEERIKGRTIDRTPFDYPPSRDKPSPSDVSMKMNALAMKYLKQEQLSQYNIFPVPQQTTRHPDVTIYNVTNLSFGTMRYMERHQMLPDKAESNRAPNLDVFSPGKLLQTKKKLAIGDDYNASVGNILDITAINKQPKLL